MKYLFCMCWLFIAQIVVAQKMPADGVSKVRITLPDKLIVAEVMPLTSSPKPVSGLWYSWYAAGIIHTTQGGFAGKLLNGKYQEFYTDKNLKEEGYFKKGLKQGSWKTWDDEGKLTETIFWKKGVQVSGEKMPILKRLNIFRRRSHKGSADTVQKQ